MGAIDISAGHYISQNEVFADICNYVLFDGKEVLKPESLREADGKEAGMPYGKAQKILPVQKYRDILKECVVKDTEFASIIMVGIENQAEIHYAMPVKNMVYDALDYAAQVSYRAREHRKAGTQMNSAEFLSGMQKGERIKPVITLVVYLGAEKWDAPRKLSEMLDIQNKSILHFICDYRVNLIVPQEIEDFEKFHSNIRYVLEFIKASKDKNAVKQLMEREKEVFSKMDLETAYLIGKCTNIPIETECEGGNVNMCQAWEDQRKEGEEAGRIEGRAEGEYKKLVIQVCKKLQKGYNMPTIADMLEEEVEMIEEICAVAKDFAPEYDTELILEKLLERRRCVVSSGK